MRASLTRPLEMVLATSTDRNAPTRFNAPATRTATLGRSAPVATEVAIALAVSWNPLVKSNASAVTTTTMTIKDSSMRWVLPPMTAADGLDSKSLRRTRDEHRTNARVVRGNETR
jgi:hypothetical protein